MKRVAITNRSRGVWELRWTAADPSGKRFCREKTVHGPKRAAEEEAFKIEREINSDTPVYQTNHTLKSWLEWWMDNVVGNRRPKTLQNYGEQVAYIVEYPIASMPLRKINAMALT